MAITLQDLVDLAQAPADGTDPKAAVAAKVAEAIAAGDDVSQLASEASDQFDALGTSEDDVTAGEVLANVVEGINDAQTQAKDAENDRAARMADLAARVKPQPAEESDDAEAGESTEAATEADTEVSETEAAEVVSEAEAATAEAAAPEPVVASASPKLARRVVLRDLDQAKQTKVAETTEDTPGRVAITAAGDVPDHSMGQDLKDIHGLTKAAVSVMSRFPSGVKGAYIKKGIAQLRVHFPEALVASGQRDDMDVIATAVDQSRLQGGSLVASGGWCSPSETIYDLAPDLASASAGVLSLPGIQVARGGIRFTQGPDFGAVWSGLGFHQTEAQAIAGAEKTVYRVPCPEFAEERAEVEGAAIEAGILQNDAYPELTERVVALAPAVHEHRINKSKLAKMESLSTAVAIEAGPSATLALLNGIELQIVDVRYQYRADETLTLEVVLPIWAKSHLRADLAMRDGVPADTINDAKINAFFADRGAVVHWVYDWQDSFSGVTNGWGSGAAKAQTTFTNSVKALVYPAGTFLEGRGDIINLSGIYDSTNLKINDFLRLFMEEKWMLIKRQWHSRVLTIPLNVNGATGVGVALGANGLPVVEDDTP